MPLETPRSNGTKSRALLLVQTRAGPPRKCPTTNETVCSDGPEVTRIQRSDRKCERSDAGLLVGCVNGRWPLRAGAVV